MPHPTEPDPPTLTFYRDAVNAPRGRKRAYNGWIANLIDWGWLEPAGAGPCLICGKPGEVWHHPSYDRGHQEWVERACQPCHNRLHTYSERRFIAEPHLVVVHAYLTFTSVLTNKLSRNLNVEMINLAMEMAAAKRKERDAS